MEPKTPRSVIVILRPGMSVPHGVMKQDKEVVNGVIKWVVTSNETLELFSDTELIATFRDWSFVKFMEPKP